MRARVLLTNTTSLQQFAAIRSYTDVVALVVDTEKIKVYVSCIFDVSLTSIPVTQPKRTC